ncbi:hypothetical protein ABIE50_001344 [Chitinophaga sp. OAE865]
MVPDGLILPETGSFLVGSFIPGRNKRANRGIYLLGRFHFAEFQYLGGPCTQLIAECRIVQE